MKEADHKLFDAVEQGDSTLPTPPEEMPTLVVGRVNVRPGKQSIPFKFDKVIRYCDENINQLTAEQFLASNLTDGLDNVLSLKVQHAIEWTHKLKNLCKDNRDKDLTTHRLLLQSSKPLREQFYRDFNPASWVDASAAVLREDPTNDELAVKLDWRRHQIINYLSAMLHFDSLIRRIENETTSGEHTIGHTDQLLQPTSYVDGTDQRKSTDLPDH